MKTWTDDQPIAPELAWTVTMISNQVWFVNTLKGGRPKLGTPSRIYRFKMAYAFVDAHDFTEYLKECGLVVSMRRNRFTHESKFWIHWAPLPQLVFVPLGEPLMRPRTKDRYTPTEQRALAVSKGLKNLNVVKQLKIADANESELAVVQRMLNEERRNELQLYLSELDAMQSQGQLRDLSQMEKMRIALLKVCEMMGLVEFVNNPDKLDSPTVQGYMNIARMLGNEAQRQLDDAKVDTKRPDDIFNKLKKIAQDNELRFKGDDVIEAEPADAETDAE